MARTSRWLVGSSSMSTSQSPMSSRARSDPSPLAARKRAHLSRPKAISLEQPRDDGANPRRRRPIRIRARSPTTARSTVAPSRKSSLWPSTPTDTPRVRMTRPSSGFHVAGEQLAAAWTCRRRCWPTMPMRAPSSTPEGQSLEHRLRGEFHPHLFATEQKRHEGRLSHWRPRPTSGLPAPFVYHISRLHQAARHASQVNSIRHRL